jgi:cob(I)alamin adenosyltransferase
MSKRLSCGYVQVYTGDGKGKTTAALGLIVRAHGADLRVYFCQFLKLGRYSEIKAISECFRHVKIDQFGCGHFVRGQPTPEDIVKARKGFRKLRAALLGGKYDVVIADEANTAVAIGLIGIEDILKLISEKPCNVELVLTGRNAHKRIIAAADLVTEMREIKHYWRKGVCGRKGIES